jgi:hypothetical protein
LGGRGEEGRKREGKAPTTLVSAVTGGSSR